MTDAPVPTLVREIRIRTITFGSGDAGYVLSYTWPGRKSNEHHVCDSLEPLLDLAREFLANGSNR